ncbi:MAG TPA: spore coat associated protein CotJA [Eubacteriaceae bacterium]|nr:spore coat associated protein CotJA [Eubacteriaceae bacterium]
MNKKRCIGYELATAYIPFQHYTVSFPPMEALRKGTLFPELYKPYQLGKGIR